MIYLKWKKKKTLSTKKSLASKTTLENEGEIKSGPNKQKQRESITVRPDLREIVHGFLQSEMKGHRAAVSVRTEIRSFSEGNYIGKHERE